MRLRSCLVVVPVLFALILAAGAERARWMSLGGDFRRSGLSGHTGPTWGCIQWKFEPGGAVVGSVTVGSDGRVHVPCEDGKLYTLDADGRLLSVLDVNTPLLSAASIGPEGDLYVGGRNGMVYAINPNGILCWNYATGDAIYSSPAVASNGDVYVGSSDGALYALAPDGRELWRFTTKGPGRLPAGTILASPAIGPDGTVYIGGLYDPNLYALDPSDGRVKWVCAFPPVGEESPGWPFASPVVAGDGTIYQTLLYDSRLYAIEPNTGAIRWSTDLLDLSAVGVEAGGLDPDASGWSEPALGPDGTIYVCLDDPYLRAVDPNGGVIKWAAQLGAIGGFTLTVDRNGLIYAACDDGYVYVVDPFGEAVTQFELGGWPAFPVVAGEDLLIVADSRDYSGSEAGSKNAVWAVSSACPEGSEPVSRQPQVPVTPPKPREPPGPPGR
jgi:outer membrane protein assembly factor BamB